MSTQTELLISTAVDVMVAELMKEYGATYIWAMRTVISSKTYQRMLDNYNFRGESPMYLYEHLKQELKHLS